MCQCNLILKDCPVFYGAISQEAIMITILMCTDEITLQCRDALFDNIPQISDDDNIEFIFENPRYYSSSKLKDDYTSLKDDSRFFKYSCKELSSGCLFRYISDAFENNDKSHINHSHLYLIGASKEMLKIVIEKYHKDLNFTVNLFVRNENCWKWVSIHNDTVLESLNVNSEAKVHVRITSQTTKLKELKSPKQRKKQQHLKRVAFIVIIALAAGIIILHMNNKRDKEIQKEKERAAIAAQEAAEKERSAAEKKERALEIAESICKQYYYEEIPYEEAENRINELAENDKEKFSSFINRINELKNSRDEYQSGMEMLEKKCFDNALYHFSNVSENDNYYYKLAQAYSIVAEDECITDQKETAEEYMLSGEYDKAYYTLQRLIDENPDNEFLITECMDQQKKYMDAWIDSQREIGNYFGDNGAVILAYTYDYFNMDGGIEMLLQEAYQHERETLIQFLNQKREELGYESMTSNDGLLLRAEGNAQLIKEGRNSEVYTEYNIYTYRAKNAEDAMSNYTQIEGIGEFAQNSRSIGIGILFDEESMDCIWVILTASQKDI